MLMHMHVQYLKLFNRSLVQTTCTSTAHFATCSILYVLHAGEHLCLLVFRNDVIIQYSILSYVTQDTAAVSMLHLVLVLRSGGSKTPC